MNVSLLVKGIATQKEMAASFRLMVATLAPPVESSWLTLTIDLSGTIAPLGRRGNGETTFSEENLYKTRSAQPRRFDWGRVLVIRLECRGRFQNASDRPRTEH
jgi:hypothetical protein